MKNLVKRIHILENSYGSTSKFSHLSDDEFVKLISEKSEAFGYRLAKEGEVVEIPKIDHGLLRAEVTKLTDKQLREVIQYRLTGHGYIQVNSEQGIN